MKAGGEDARAAFGRLINAPEDAIAVSAVAGLVAAQLPEARPGENILVGASEFTSNLFPWQLLRAKGYDVRLLPVQDGDVAADTFSQAADARTRLVAVSAVQSASGYQVDLAALWEIANRSQAWLFVDGSQIVGALPLDVTDLSIDVLAVPSHKFFTGSRGMGYAYIRPDRLDAFTPVFPGWKAAVHPTSSFYGPEMILSPTASRLDLSLAWFVALAERASLQTLEELGIGAILELVGGFLILIGLWTRPVAFILAGEMAVAYWWFHFPRNFYPTLNGGDAAILYCFVFLLLVFTGPGALSVDGLRGQRAYRPA